MKLSNEEFDRARSVVLSSDPLAIARYVTRLHFGEVVEDVPAELQETLVALDWVKPGKGGLTETGWFVSDSCREYLFWRERERKLPFAELVPDVVSERLVGKAVLEIGSGSGMNLLSMAPLVTHAVGLEPMEIYRQMGAIFAEAEGLANVEAVRGAAEALPFADGQFETVLCVTAHQYFDLVPAVNQIARVVRPGGEAVLIGGFFSAYALSGFGQIFAGFGAARNYLVTVVNTLSFMLIGRRIIIRQSKWSTAFPIYPSRSSVVRLLRNAGLEMVAPPKRIGGEAVFRARKRG